MNSSAPFAVNLIERLVAIALLLILVPVLLCVAAIILLTSGRPVLITDIFSTPDGASVSTYRFHARGALGDFMHRYSIDELPILWAVVRGDIGLMDLFRRNENPPA